MIFEQFLSQICPREKVESWEKTKKSRKKRNTNMFLRTGFF